MTEVPERLRRTGSRDRLRLGYPDELVADVLAYARLDGQPALEVGAGSGRATMKFVARGIKITAVEPNARLAAVLTRRVAGAPVTVAVSTFEDYVPDRRFGLLFSAQAWHRVDPAVRWRKAAEAVTPGGVVALFWNRERPADRAVNDEIRAAHQVYAPRIPFDREMLPDPPPWPGIHGLAHRDSHVYRWQVTMPTVDFVATLATRSAYTTLEPETRSTLFADILRRLDNEVRVAVDTELYQARTR
ncbi:Methyltransferase domain-containing protein [Asanoa hainanensis]|uniref:Methyltransferase domain-containing protein n=1 Tax=Asanoa hainanensis TaxID=560556 RepID=A0A239PGA4_9ACTN|nr:methyltransferase domain-containing protein [Asanoa hainanensis]SNT65990.1 Methyltransferase domain-containing protein [Asanoa hainanensis]